MWRAFDSENEEAMAFPMCFPEDTWAESADRWTAAGFPLGKKADIALWERLVEALPTA